MIQTSVTILWKPCLTSKSSRSIGLYSLSVALIAASVRYTKILDIRRESEWDKAFCIIWRYGARLLKGISSEERRKGMVSIQHMEYIILKSV